MVNMSFRFIALLCLKFKLHFPNIEKSLIVGSSGKEVDFFSVRRPDRAAIICGMECQLHKVRTVDSDDKDVQIVFVGN